MYSIPGKRPLEQPTKQQLCRHHKTATTTYGRDLLINSIEHPYNHNNQARGRIKEFQEESWHQEENTGAMSRNRTPSIAQALEKVPLKYFPLKVWRKKILLGARQLFLCEPSVWVSGVSGNNETSNQDASLQERTRPLPGRLSGKTFTVILMYPYWTDMCPKRRHYFLS